MIKLHMNRTAVPQFYRVRQVLYALRDKIEEELDRLQRARAIKPVQYSDWAVPVVPVRKGDGSVRLCGDYKLTVNEVALLDTYPIPRIEDLFARLAGVGLSQPWT